MVASLKQVDCIPGGNGKIRASEVRDDCDIYSNNFPVAVKERPARTARCRRGIINDLVFKDVPYMSLRGDRPDKVLRGELRHDDSEVSEYRLQSSAQLLVPLSPECLPPR